VHAMPIWTFEQEYHYEDFEQNKYQVSVKKKKLTYKKNEEIYLLVIQQEQQQRLRLEEYVVQTSEMLSEDNLPYKSYVYPIINIEKIDYDFPMTSAHGYTISNSNLPLMVLKFHNHTVYYSKKKQFKSIFILNQNNLLHENIPLYNNSQVHHMLQHFQQFSMNN